MKTTESMQRFLELNYHYLEELNQLSLEQLKLSPSETEWSLGQMYLHLIHSALNMQLRNAEECRLMNEDAMKTPEDKTEAGAAIFAQGGFPPVRIQVPAGAQYTPEQPESKEQIVEGLNAVVQRMKEIEPLLEKIPSQNKVRHPRLGALNAQEWFELVEMHYRHHLHQMGRLKELFQ